MPVQIFVGRIEAVAGSDLPRFEQVGSRVPPQKPGLFYAPPLGPQRYVLLVPGSVYRPLADAAKPGRGGLAPLVRVRGAPVDIPGPRGTAKAVVVQGVEILKS